MRKLEGRWLEPHERPLTRAFLENSRGQWVQVGDFDFDLPNEDIVSSEARVTRQPHTARADYIEAQLELPNQEELRGMTRAVQREELRRIRNQTIARRATLQSRPRPNVQSERWDLGANQTREVESQNLFEELRRRQNENFRR